MIILRKCERHRARAAPTPHPRRRAHLEALVAPEPRARLDVLGRHVARGREVLLEIRQVPVLVSRARHERLVRTNLRERGRRRKTRSHTAGGEARQRVRERYRRA